MNFSKSFWRAACFLVVSLGAVAVTAFGPNLNGQVVTDFCGLGDRPFTMTLDAAGRIVLAGYT